MDRRKFLALSAVAFAGLSIAPKYAEGRITYKHGHPKSEIPIQLITHVCTQKA